MSEVISEQSLQNELNELFNENINEERQHKLDLSKKTKLVLSGGGVKGIAHLGALKALQEHGILQKIDTFAGTSVGAMIASLLIIGYSPDDQLGVISGIDLGKMKKRIKFDNMLNSFGLDDGSGMEIIINKMFRAKGFSPDITFQQLYEKTQKTLIATVACLNNKKSYYFSHTSVPNMKVIMAVRMSISLPIYFVPVKHQGKLFIDGGCIDNYPIQLFNHCLDEVIGLHLSDGRETVVDITNIEDFLIHAIQCIFEGVSKNAIKGYENYSIKISIKNISAVDMEIDPKMKQKLFEVGYKTVINKIK